MEANTLFGANIPKSPDIRVDVKLTVLRGGSVLAWQGPSETNELEIHESICRSQVVAKFVKRAGKCRRLTKDESGIYLVPAKIVCIELGQPIHTASVDIPIALGAKSKKRSKDAKLLAKANLKINKAIISQQKDIPVQMREMLAAVVENGQKSITMAAEKSAAIITAAIDPLTKAFGLIEKAYLHESTRADKANDAVIRMLNSKPKEDTFLDDVSKVVAMGGPAIALIKEVKKAVS